jgi:hypothetical protein
MAQHDRMPPLAVSKNGIIIFNGICEFKCSVACNNLAEKLNERRKEIVP